MPRQDATRAAPCGKVLQTRGYKLHVKQCKRCAEVGADSLQGEGSPADDSPADPPPTPPPASPPTDQPAERPAGPSFRGRFRA